jgi:DNA-binding transcriptional ArsR family regulator
VQATADSGFEALAHPARRAIMQRLAKGPRTASELAADFPYSQPAFSQHLRVLRKAGLVEARPSAADARSREYRLRPGSLDGVTEWIDTVEQFWKTQLSAFARYAEARSRSDNGRQTDRRGERGVRKVRA